MDGPIFELILGPCSSVGHSWTRGGYPHITVFHHHVHQKAAQLQQALQSSSSTRASAATIRLRGGKQSGSSATA